MADGGDNADIDKLASAVSDAGVLQLPTDLPAGGQYAESEEMLDFSDDTTMNILRASMENTAAKPFSYVFAALAVTLHKLCREDKFLVGGLSTGTQKLSPMIMNVKSENTLKDVLAMTVKALDDADKSTVDITDLAVKVHPDSNRNVAVSKLFQVCVYNGTDTNAADELNKIAKEDWTVYIESIPDAKKLLPLRIRFSFNAVQYSRKQIQQILEQVELVTGQITGKPEQKVLETTLLTGSVTDILPNPNAELDDTWNGPIFTFLSKYAKEKPDAPLIVHNDQTYTYKEVDEHSNRLANFLRESGIQTGERVAMYSHRSSALVVGIIGILKAGATFTVIDPAYPVERQITFLTVAQPKGIIIMKAAGKIKDAVQEYIDNDLSIRCQLNNLSMEVEEPLTKFSVESCGVEIGPNDIGTLSFTSGSTGLPKGVRGRHISLTHFYPWMSEEFKMGKHDRFSMLSGIAHDPIQRDVFTPIFYGATICIPDAEDIVNPGALAKWVARDEVSVVHLTPAMGQLLTANAKTQMPSLKVALFVGDVLTKRDVKRLQRLAPNITTVNMYGTTETQRAVSYLKIPNDNSINRFKEILPSGRGMKDVQLLVLTKNFDLAGMGELGEIFVRSPHLSAGYLLLPEPTAAKFLTNPFTNKEGDRMYRTGDLGRFRTDGTVECVGRADDQVKIRGFRVELGEIDTHLGQHPDVQANKTLVMRDASEEKQIISFFVPMTDQYSIEKIRAHLKEKLPTYCVPTVICPIPKMPLTPNGKVDTRRLPYPDSAIIMAQRPKRKEDEENVSPLATSIKAVFEKVLGRPVLMSDNFFEIGGHSILATQLTFQLREELKQPFDLQLLYQYPTVKQLAEVLEDSLDNDYAVAPAKDEEDTIDLEVETSLDSSISPQNKSLPESIKGVLLTGGTGFLGAFILAELLKKYPDAIIRCLVRAENDSAGFQRLEKNLKNHLLWDEANSSRIAAIVGDLSKPGLGIDSARFDDLSESTDLIVHNGAVVHWVYPYAKLKAANVLSTIECLRLATRGKTLASVHFVSSTSVFDSNYYMDRNQSVLESEDLDGFSGLSVGYAQSKWVAEKLVLKAIDRGCPATIFRPGYIMGHSVTGVSNTDDYLARLIKGCIQLQKAPQMRNVINACPVDFVSQAIVHISSVSENYGKCYHFFQPKTFRIKHMFERAKAFGAPIEFVEYLEWRDALMKLTMAETESNALYPLLHFVLDDLPAHSRTPPLDTSQLLGALDGSGVSCNAIHDLMGVYLGYLLSIGFIKKDNFDLNGADEKLPELQDLSHLSHVTRNNRV